MKTFIQFQSGTSACPTTTAFIFQMVYLSLAIMVILFLLISLILLSIPLYPLSLVIQWV